MKNNNDMKAVLQELAEEAMITGGGCLDLRPGWVGWTALSCVSPLPVSAVGCSPDTLPAPGRLAPPRKGYRHGQGPKARGGRRPESATPQAERTEPQRRLSVHAW